MPVVQKTVSLSVSASGYKAASTGIYDPLGWVRGKVLGYKVRTSAVTGGTPTVTIYAFKATQAEIDAFGAVPAPADKFIESSSLTLGAASSTVAIAEKAFGGGGSDGAITPFSLDAGDYLAIGGLFASVGTLATVEVQISLEVDN